MDGIVDIRCWGYGWKWIICGDDVDNKLEKQ